MISRHIIAVAATALGLAGCAGNPETGTGPKENTGTAVGAITGALIGSQFGGNTGSRVAAGVAGAALGGLIGNRIGASLDDQDRERSFRRAGGMAKPRLGAVWLGGAWPIVPAEWRNLPPVHPHYIY